MLGWLCMFLLSQLPIELSSTLLLGRLEALYIIVPHTDSIFIDQCAQHTVGLMSCTLDTIAMLLSELLGGK